MAAFVNFTSSTVIENQKQVVREARQNIIDKAKTKYEQTERRAQEAKLRGEDTWMLSSVDKRIQSEEQEHKKTKERHKKEKKRKKKHKKHKKQASSSDGDSDSAKEPQWVEKSSALCNSSGTDHQSETASKPTIGPTLQRESWMECPLDVLPTICKKEIREKKKKEDEMEKKAAAEKIGQHTRELNPYWKDGGTGLPEDNVKPAKSSIHLVGVGDSGLSWLRKRYERCKQQADDEGRSMEDVAAERFGSLKKLEKMIHEAEKAEERLRRKRYDKTEKRSHDNNKNHSRSQSPDGERSRSDRGQYRRSRSPVDQSRSEKSHERENYDKTRDQSMRAHDKKREFHRDQSSSLRSHVDQSLRNENYDSTRNENKGDKYERRPESSRRRQFIKPDSYSDETSRHGRDNERRFVRPKESESDPSRHSESSRRRFMKPGDMPESSSRSRSGGASSREEPRWKRPGFRKPSDDVNVSSGENNKSENRDLRERERSLHRSRSCNTSPSPSSSSSSSSSDDDGVDEDEVETAPTQPQVVVLSEKEMNELGAKIIRAELMGDESMAQELKSKLEEARKMKETRPTVTSTDVRPESDGEEVVLTRTGRGGVILPLPERSHEPEQRGRKRRKKETVSTHEAGERVRYFDDDDKFSLKSLVEREKMGTAEDQNSMFARLAGRVCEKTDEDYQMDDVIITKAACKQSEAELEEKDRTRAIFEHRKISAAMEKCNYCFNKVPKHLIIAIGVKVYLCLPNYRSLTAGHCLIVLMFVLTRCTCVCPTTAL
ncbi:CWF19-like protein 2 isoform X2 [Gigantopelta aegis]|uniref:CWF19-like protein 2 isoform X2 n=1 Tax=Gigantopelta aegis TaxID=1735272 RepID=UPI001B889BC8|nr:CWF19-like protein 2 isoform X2 [Gigantopelta aegis]